jgi:hypothetical protein
VSVPGENATIVSLPGIRRLFDVDPPKLTIVRGFELQRPGSPFRCAMRQMEYPEGAAQTLLENRAKCWHRIAKARPDSTGGQNVAMQSNHRAFLSIALEA